eukprot:g1660.t1
MYLPLSIEYAELFCSSNDIYDEQCPVQIIRKLIIDNNVNYNDAQIIAILQNKYFTLEAKLDVFKLSQKTNTKYVSYKLLSFINKNKCYSNTYSNSNNKVEVMQQIETTSTSTVTTSQEEDGEAANTTPILLTRAQIEFNELFALSSFEQLDIKNALTCYNILLRMIPTNIVYNFNYGALLGNIGNFTGSIYYLSIAAKQHFFPAALALAKSTIGTFNFTINKYYLTLAEKAAKTPEEKLLVALRTATLLSSIYVSEQEYIHDIETSVVRLKTILKTQLQFVDIELFLANQQYIEYAFYGALDGCTHHNPHTDTVIMAKRTLSTILRQLSHARKYTDKTFFLSASRVGTAPATAAVQQSKPKNVNIVKEIRIGFATSFFRQHSVAKYTCPLMKQLKEYHHKHEKNGSSIRFYIVGIGIGEKCHPNKKFTKEAHNIAFKNCRDAANLYIHYQNGATDELFAKIISLKLDVLIYPEVGLDSTVYLMSLARLAPVQIAHLGNAVTHGISTIDYVVHSLKFLPGSTIHIRKQRLIQTVPFPVCHPNSINKTYDGLNHTEKILCFHTNALYLNRPLPYRHQRIRANNFDNNGNEKDILLKSWELLKKHNVNIPKPESNNYADNDFGNNTNIEYDHMYLLPHTPLKYSNGERDYLYEQMLINDPKAKLVFLQPFRQDAADTAQKILRKRWEGKNLTTLLSNDNRYVWLPFVPLDVYIALGKLSNVVLDVCPNGMGT